MPEYRGGGFLDSAESRLPETLIVAVEVADELDRRDVEREARRAAERASQFEMRSIQASAVLAEDRGELVNRREALTRGVGHTPSEFVALCAAEQDLEDLRAEQRERAAFEKWKRDRQEGTWADTSAPTEAEVVEREQTAARARTRRNEDDLVITARELARLDRERPGWDRQWTK
jgi:hypothetical protein